VIFCFISKEQSTKNSNVRFSTDKIQICFFKVLDYFKRKGKNGRFVQDVSKSQELATS